MISPREKVVPYFSPVQVRPGAHRHFEYPAGVGILAPVVAESDRLPGVFRLQGRKEVHGFEEPAGQRHRGRAEAVDLFPVDKDFGIIPCQEADIVPVPDAVRERSVHFEYVVFVVFIPLVRGDFDGIPVFVPRLQPVQVDDVAAPGFNLRVGHGVDGGADCGGCQEHEETEPENIEYFPVARLVLHGGFPPPVSALCRRNIGYGFLPDSAVIRRAGHPAHIRPGCPRCGRFCRRWRRSHRRR